MGQRKLFGALLIAALTLFAAGELFAQADVIGKRQKLMKSNSADAKAIKSAVGKKDYATVQTKAKDIMGNMDRVLDLFPKGSTGQKSRAKAEIWEKWDQFSKNPAKVKKAAEELAEAAANKNDAEMGAKFKALGAACNGCHKPFRAPQKK